MKDIVDLIYEAAIDDECFSALASAIARDGCYESALVLLRRQFDLIEGSFEIDPDYIGSYIDYYAHVDPLVDPSQHAPPGEIRIGDEFASGREGPETDFARHPGAFEPMGMSLPIGHDLTLSFAVNRPRGARFTEADAAWMRALAPHLRRSMEMRRRLSAMRSADRARRTILDGLAFGVVVVDAEGGLHVANADAEEMLSRGDLIRQRDGRVGAARRPGRERLAALFRDVAAGGSGGALRLVDLAGAPALNVLVSPAPPSLGGAERTLALATFQRIEEKAPVPEAVLAQLFHLSRAEAGLVTAFATGHSIDDIARLRGVSLTTARTQLRSVFRKTGTRNQTDLMRLIGSLPRLSYPSG